jgi:hypothetical protein
MLDIKISIPNETSNSSFAEFIDYESKLYFDVNFHINTNIEEADFWFVFEDLNKENEKCTVRKDRIFYLNQETSYDVSYFLQTHMKEFLNQFNSQYGSYQTYTKKYKNTLPFLPWMINFNSAGSLFDKTGKNVEFLRNFKKPKKNKMISIICSDKKITDAHKVRYEFTHNLKEYFGENLDWYGQGVNPINDKWQAIKDYKYHIVLENGQRDNLISEKLYDAYLGLSFPLYFGAPNINDYFPKNSLRKINIYNFEESLNTIEKILSSDIYEKNYKSLEDSRDLVLSKYNFTSRIYEIIADSQNKKSQRKKGTVILKNVNHYWSKHTPIKKKVKHVISRKFRLNI